MKMKNSYEKPTFKSDVVKLTLCAIRVICESSENKLPTLAEPSDMSRIAKPFKRPFITYKDTITIPTYQKEKWELLSKNVRFVSNFQFL